MEGPPLLQHVLLLSLDALRLLCWAAPCILATCCTSYVCITIRNACLCLHLWTSAFCFRPGLVLCPSAQQHPLALFVSREVLVRLVMRCGVFGAR